MTETTEVSVKLALCVLAAGVVVFRHVRAELRDERAGVVLAFVAFVAGLAYYNFRTFHGDSSVHAHEQFHYFLGSKYFPELGYDGLYAASIAAERRREPDAAIQDFIQDLRINRVRRTDDLKAHESEVVARFRTPGRDNWDPFATDNGYFLETNDAETISAMRLDHGFNGTPTWAFVGRLFSSSLPASEGTFLLLSNLDNLLLAAAFLAIFAAYGGRVGCLSVIVFGLAYASRYYWVGGGFLRQDWLAATVIGVCLLKLGRPASAGAALGYAAMVRIFPVLFLVGPILVAVRGSLDGDSRSLRRLCGGFFVAVILGVAAGCFVGRGVGAWSDFARNIELQRTTWLTNSVGLTTALVQNSGTLDERYVDRSLPDPWRPWEEAMERSRKRRWLLIWLARVAFITMIGAVAWRSPADEAAILGLALVFALVDVANYYWGMLLLVPLCRRGWPATVALLVLNATLFGVHLLSPIFEVRYAATSWALGGFFISWVALVAVRNFRQSAN